jgi:hypothetical protein
MVDTKVDFLSLHNMKLILIDFSKFVAIFFAKLHKILQINVAKCG